VLWELPVTPAMWGSSWEGAVNTSCWSSPDPRPFHCSPSRGEMGATGWGPAVGTAGQGVPVVDQSCAPTKFRDRPHRVAPAALCARWGRNSRHMALHPHHCHNRQSGDQEEGEGSQEDSSRAAPHSGALIPLVLVLVPAPAPAPAPSPLPSALPHCRTAEGTIAARASPEGCEPPGAPRLSLHSQGCCCCCCCCRWHLGLQWTWASIDSPPPRPPSADI